LDEDFKIAFVTNNSDLQSQDIISLMKLDSSGLNDIFQCGVQLPLKQRLPPELLVKDVVLSFLDERLRVCGGRLGEFKKQQGINKDGLLNYSSSVGSYKLNWDDKTKLLAEIVHCSGAKVVVNPKLGLTTSYTLSDNFDDFAATLNMHPMPAIKLYTLFDSKSKQGPFSYFSYQSTPKDLAARARQLYSVWETSMKHASAAVAPTAVVKRAIEEHRSEKNKATMSKARASAMEALAAKRARRSIAFDT
jgi:hypothetical protein